MSETNQTNTNQWPGAFAVFKPSKEAIMVNISVLVLLFLIGFAAQIVISLFIKNEAVNQILSNIITYILGPAYYIAILRGIAKTKVELQPTLKESLGYVVQYFILNIVTAVAIVFSILAFLIPFFFVMPRLILAPFFLIDQKLDAITALKASWDQTKGHSAKVWGIIGASFVMALPFFTIIGIPVAIYLLVMYSAASGILYKYIVSHQPATQE
jgi:hypothetical protein